MLIPTIINHAFSRNEELDHKIVHRRLGHIYDDKLNGVSKLEIIKDLSKRKSKRCVSHKAKYWICWKTSTVNVTEILTQSTEHLRPGSPLHDDFCFIEF